MQSRNSHRGQATVEFALVAPLVVVCASLLIGVTVACLQVIQLNDIARTTARLAATAENPRTAAEEFAATRGVDVDVDENPSNGLLSVRISRQSRIPLLGRISRIVGLGATATMIRESPPILSR